jgi:hypothetical protein
VAVMDLGVVMYAGRARHRQEIVIAVWLSS